MSEMMCVPTLQRLSSREPVLFSIYSAEGKTEHCRISLQVVSIKLDITNSSQDSRTAQLAPQTCLLLDPLTSCKPENGAQSLFQGPRAAPDAAGALPGSTCSGMDLGLCGAQQGSPSCRLPLRSTAASSPHILLHRHESRPQQHACSRTSLQADCQPAADNQLGLVWNAGEHCAS